MNRNTTTPGRTDDASGQKRLHSSPSLIQTGNMAMLFAIFLSVAPGIDLGTATLGVALIGIVFYAVEALGQVYDLGAAVAAEVRA